MDGELKYVHVVWIRYALCGSGNPCRNDGLPTDLCKDERGAWERDKEKRLLNAQATQAFRPY